MQKFVINLFIFIAIIGKFSFTVASEENINQVTEPVSFADLVEPLLPTVVNIYTIKYNDEKRYKNNQLSKLVPFEEFIHFLKKFNIPLSFDLQSNPKTLSLGSGFIIDENGLIVTNHHVIVGSDEIHVKLSDNTELPAVIVGVDPQTDLALIKINHPKKLAFVSFGDSNKIRIGDAVIAIGNSLGFGNTVTTGIISSKGRDLGSGIDELVDDFLQTDAAINTGSSGGPLFNIEGKVIGVNTSIPAVAGGTNVGISFAIPSNRVENTVNELKKNGKISRGKLDIAIQENSKELSEALNIDTDYGVLVVDVKAQGAGDQAGLKRGDLIIEFNDKKVLNSRKLQLFVAESQVGDEINLTIIRDGENINLKAIVSEIIEDEQEDESESNNQHSETISTEHLLEKSDVIFTNLTEDLKNKFNLDQNNNGIFVVGLKADDSNIKLRVGDIVLAVNQESVNDIEQFDLIYKKLQSSSKKTAILLVKRKDFSMFVVLTIK